jgi:two-component system cell cycle sensor histidine kinase/response regulator CckA
MEMKKTILVVDDNAAIVTLLETALTSFGYHVLSALSAQEAMVIHQENSPVDLLLTDIRLGGMNGYDLATALAGIQPGLKVLYMSGANEEDFKMLLVLPAASSFVAKPFRLGALNESIQRAMAG